MFIFLVASFAGVRSALYLFVYMGKTKEQKIIKLAQVQKVQRIVQQERIHREERQKTIEMTVGNREEAKEKERPMKKKFKNYRSTVGEKAKSARERVKRSRQKNLDLWMQVCA